MQAYLTFAGDASRIETSRELLRRALEPGVVEVLEDGRVSYTGERVVLDSALAMLKGWSVWRSAAEQQAEWNQFAGVFFAASTTMVVGVAMIMAALAAFTGQLNGSTVRFLLGFVLVATLGIAALLTFILPVRPQWGPALRSIRFAGARNKQG